MKALKQDLLVHHLATKSPLSGWKKARRRGVLAVAFADSDFPSGLRS